MIERLGLHLRASSFPLSYKLRHHPYGTRGSARIILASGPNWSLETVAPVLFIPSKSIIGSMNHAMGKNDSGPRTL
jgi:hypothetical protein